MFRMTGDIFSGPYGKRKVFQICKHLPACVQCR